MKNHTDDCEVTTTGVCTCQPEPKARRHDDSCASWTGSDCNCHVTAHSRATFAHRFGRPPRDGQELAEWIAVEANRGRGKAGTSRRIDTDPKVTWLGDQRHEHPPFCGVYSVHVPDGNWAPFCTCYIARLQGEPHPPMLRRGEPEVPKELRPDPQRFMSRAPWWVWTLIGFGAGLPLGAWAGWPSW